MRLSWIAETREMEGGAAVTGSGAIFQGCMRARSYLGACQLLVESL